MKKDLKDFFVQAAGVAKNKEPQVSSTAHEESSKPAPKRRRKSAKRDDDFEYYDADIPEPPVKRKSRNKKSKSAGNGDAASAVTKPKRKHNKRKLTENGDESCPSDAAPIVIVTSDESSESHPVKDHTKKKPRLSSEKMSPACSPENDPQASSPATANNSLFNYFNKVDKAADGWSTPKPTLIKVKVDIHDPPPADPEEKKKRSPQFEELKNKLRIRLGKTAGQNMKKSRNSAEYDVIICESVEDYIPEPPNEVTSSVVVDVVTIVDEPLSSTPVITNGLTPVIPKPAKSAVKMKHDGTLASFFTIGNRVPKPMETEEQKQARINFLQSSSPASIKRILSAPGSEPVLSYPAPLPKVSHVCQKDPMHILWNLPPANLPLRSADSARVVPKAWSSLTDIRQCSSPVPEPSDLPEGFDQKKELKRLKRETENPVAQWLKYMKEMKKEKDGLIWSEKYRPSSAAHLSLADISNVQKFQSWLTNLGESVQKDEGEYDSGDDFVTEDDSCDRHFRTKRAALLTGPPGIGKTAIVYAVAKELGYEVLELNASENRSGKRILNEFSEALQSHKVETNQLTNFMGKKKKDQKPKLPKKTLILIEDADLVFAENDEGFLTTVSNLAASSKRPVVFIANERDSKHLLSKIASQVEIEIHFSSLRLGRLNSWLRTICLAESFHASSMEIQGLISWAKTCDIRKCLLQLEFCKAGSRELARVIRSDCRAARAMWNKLTDIDVDYSKISREKCLELLSLVDVLLTSNKTQVRDDNPCRRHWDVDERDSTELTCPTPDSTCLLTEDIASYGLSFIDDNVGAKTTCFNKLSKRNECLADMEQCLLSPHSFLSRSAVALDLSPALREIARSEQLRFSTQTKRNNRYFHYLRPDDHRSNSKLDFNLFSQPFHPSGEPETSVEVSPS